MKRGQQIKIKMSKIEKIKNLNKIKIKPTHEEVKEAVKILIKWAGDDPDREGLIETPDRVIKAYENFFSGYNNDPRDGILYGGYAMRVRLAAVRLNWRSPSLIVTEKSEIVIP